MKIPRRATYTLALAVAITFVPNSSFAWGNEGHTYVNQAAAQKIPRNMPLFFRQAVGEIAYLGPEPDRWRNPAEAALKNAQEPDHFIDLERVEWLNPLPQVRYEFIRKLYEKRASTTEHPDDYLPEHVGMQPYITMEVYGRLKAAFREYRIRSAAHQPTLAVQRAIVFYAGWLGHYVGDGAQPLHTSVQYNGWGGPNPNGYTTEHTIHWAFEGPYVGRNLKPADFVAQVHAPERLSDPFADYMAYLNHSREFVEKVYQLEKAGEFKAKGTPEGRSFTAGRLAAGSQMLLNLWYTAWLDSVPPPQSGPAKTN